MERLTVLRFSFSSCTSQSSVDAVENPSKKSKLDPSSSTLQGAIQKPNNISIGIQRLIKSFKSFSQTFVYKEEEEDDEDVEMKIGLPTDVKHVAHIGWDGSTATKSNATLSNNVVKDWFLWENLNTHPHDMETHQNESISNTSISLRQFELAMAAQANNGHDATTTTTTTTTTTQPLVLGSLKKPITTTATC